MNEDKTIRQHVIEQLMWEPCLKQTQIAVSVHDGIITLSGEVDSYAKKLVAEKAAKKVRGVKALVEDIHVVLPGNDYLLDTTIAAAALQALKWDALVPDKQITVQVENGMVKLEGEVDWDYQRMAAAKAIRNMAGIKAVFNAITLKHRLIGGEIKQQIANAFHRIASIDAGTIEAEVVGSKVTLNGTVRSFAEKEEAEKTAWQAPGITFVDNRLNVGIPGI